jgi:hypothetical protein
MSSRFHTLKFLGLLLTAGLVSGQAMAQSVTATANTNAVIIKPITLAKASDLSFGRLASVAGIVSIAADTGTRSSTVPANLIADGTGTAPGRASFTVGGESSLTYAISAPATTIELSNAASDKLTVTLTGVYRLNSTATGAAGAASTGMLTGGADTLGVGGALTLANNTPSGTYSNTGGISLTVNYN